MAARLEPTRFPGVYRRGSRYAYHWRDRLGKQRWGSAATESQARRAKAEAERLVRGGGDSSRLYLHDYGVAALHRYRGGSRGIRPETLAEYQADFARFVTFFGRRAKLTDVGPREVDEFVSWLAAQPGRRAATLSDARIRNVLKPFRAVWAMALREDLIVRDPWAKVQLPAREDLELDEPDVRALSEEQLAAALALAQGERRLLLWTLAATGLRASELIGLEVRHAVLSGSEPRLLVRQRWRSGKIGVLKSRHARREIALTSDLALALRPLSLRPGREPLFANRVGSRLDRDNVRQRMIAPILSEVGFERGGWHTLRHTCASVLFSRGYSVVQVQRWLGHHAPSFTLDTYIHLLPGDAPPPLELGVELPVTVRAT